MKFHERLISAVIGSAIFVGLPWLFNAPWFLWFSWIPAGLIMSYLDEDDDSKDDGDGL